MLFGYLIIRALLVLVRVFGLLPDGASKAFARLLDSARRPFGLINYLGSCAGARIIRPRRMTTMLDHVIAALHKHLQRETDSALRRGMHYPTTWDPFFADYMTLAGHLSLPHPALPLPPAPAHAQPTTLITRHTART
jgi:hypothetical protein